jgi:PelA/Pel-15E family pectate lyase
LNVSGFEETAINLQPLFVGHLTETHLVQQKYMEEWKMITRYTTTLGLAALISYGVAAAGASVIGKNPPAQSLTRARIEQSPVRERAAWLAYLDRSERQRQIDKNIFAAELKRAGIKAPSDPPHGYEARSIPLDHDSAWYGSAEARRIADIVVSFQTPAGGWGKNLDMSKEPRQPGERYGPDNLSRFLAPDDFDTPREPDWNYIGTIDNDATTTQLNFLVKVIAADGAADTRKYREAFLHGIRYLLEAQYPNGGWPQVWPLEGGYHDAVTFNDDAMTQVMELMRNVSEGQGDFRFVPRDVRAKARSSFGRGLPCILATQIRSDGKLTAWPQQDDPLTLKPTSARNYELPAASAGESTSILLLLMDLPHPTAAEQQSIRAGITWLHKTAIYGQKWEPSPQGRELVAAPEAGPIWARYYEIGSDRPIFGDRDKTIHADVNELSRERRNGYNWYSAEATRALGRFTAWSDEHPEMK